jgi:hypothetical protein
LGEQPWQGLIVVFQGELDMFLKSAVYQCQILVFLSQVCLVFLGYEDTECLGYRLMMSISFL